MNALTSLPTAADRDAHIHAQRYDGWTPDRQRAFLEFIADGHTVDSACRLVGMSAASAYALRRRAAGAPFAIGWTAANLIARDKIADTLLARAIDGQVETYTRPDGATFSRHRFDNRLATGMLARLDRFAEDHAGDPQVHAARLVAREFDGFLDLIDRDEGPARAGLFVGLRIAGEEADPDLGAIVSLARADRWLRSGAGSAGEVDVSDLDPGQRAGWTAEQWARAEAAGLVAFAAPEETAPASQLSQLPHGEEADPDQYQPVWWDEYADAWRTSFPPPDGFDGEEDGVFGDDDYERALSAEEESLMDAGRAIDRAVRRAAEARERDAWFAALIPGDDAEEADDGDDAGAPDLPE